MKLNSYQAQILFHVLGDSLKIDIESGFDPFLHTLKFRQDIYMLILNQQGHEIQELEPEEG